MNILFLTLSRLDNLNERGIYTDLLRRFVAEGHSVSVLFPQERRDWQRDFSQTAPGAQIIPVRTLNVQKTNFVEKGISTILIEQMFLRAIKRNFSSKRFDLVLFTTPPITFARVVRYVKERDGAYAYLLLKDIFPQNAVDLGYFTKSSLMYRYFRYKEKQLYDVADKIGCLSPANVDFLLKHNDDLDPQKIEINSNTIEPLHPSWTPAGIDAVKRRYNIPPGRRIFLYGGNLGKPQGLDFLLDTILRTTNAKAYFLIVGHGTEYQRIRQWFHQHRPENAGLINYLPKDEYDRLIAACDVGLVFLHPAFTIPNFPSRLLSYLENSFPVICATDPNTDIGDIVEEAGAGFRVVSGDHQRMQMAIDTLCDDEQRFMQMRANALKLLNEKYLVGGTYDKIMANLQQR